MSYIADDEYLTVDQVAKTFNVTTRTVYRWIKQGIISSKRTRPFRGGVIIPRTEVERLRRETLLDTGN